MVATTFLFEHELNQPTGDSELDELLAVAKEVSKSNYQIVMHGHTERHGIFNHKSRHVRTPQLYVEVPGVGPWQVLQCAHDRATVMAFLYGLLNGHRHSHGGDGG